MNNSLVPIASRTRVYVYKDPVNMGYSFPKLLEIVQSWKGVDLKLDQGGVYVFLNRHRDYCKILFQGKGGLCILGKKLSTGIMSIGYGQHVDLKHLGNAINPATPHRKQRLVSQTVAA